MSVAEVAENTAFGRNPGIDILRGLSIVLVVMHHVGLRIPLKHGVLALALPKWLLSALIYNGYEAVFVFFVISGFLITSNTLARWGGLGEIDIRAFYVRRGARILPCLLISALGVVALSLPVARAALAGNEIWQEKAYLPGMAAIAAGVIGALIATRFRPQRRGIVLSLGTAGVGGIIAVLCVEDKLWHRLGNGTMLVLTCSTVFLLLAFDWQARRSGSWTIPGTGWLRSFGRLSYEIYLTHMFVVMTVISIFKRHGAGMRWGILWYVPSLIFSWALGWLVAHYLSVPAEHAVRRRMTPSVCAVGVAARVG